MLRSMDAAVTALGVHQQFMDVVANNLANVNTTGYKTSRVDFKTQISQLQAPGSAPTAATATPALGGMNPIQIGLGVQLGAVTKVMTQGTLRNTGRVTDLAIQGDGFFVIDDGTQAHAYTRDGAVDMDSTGTLTQIATGQHILGWQADPVTGVVNPTGPLTPIVVPTNTTLARATSATTLNGNLDSATAVAGTVTSTMSVYDSLGNQHNITLTYTKTGNNAWTVAPSTTDAAITGLTIANANLTFNAAGQLTAPAAPLTPTLAVTLNNGSVIPPTGTPGNVLSVNVSALSQLAQTSNVTQASQDGLAPGTLTGLSVVSNTGMVTGIFSNGLTMSIGQVALANFTNPAGLLASGQNLYRPWLNSGDPQVGTPGNGSLGTVASGYLEGSNVDMAQEFTNMITAQRGFQANSRTITTSDEMLQELLSMKR